MFWFPYNLSSTESICEILPMTTENILARPSVCINEKNMHLQSQCICIEQDICTELHNLHFHLHFCMEEFHFNNNTSCTFLPRIHCKCVSMHTILFVFKTEEQVSITLCGNRLHITYAALTCFEPRTFL